PSTCTPLPYTTLFRSPLWRTCHIGQSRYLSRGDQRDECAQLLDLSQKSSGRIGTRAPCGAAGACGGRTSRQSACARGASSELSCERTGVTTGRPAGPAVVVARM